VRAASPWLKAVRQITVICVDDDAGHSFQTTAIELFASLRVDVTTAGISSDPEPVACALLGHSTSIGATCIVAGAYRHNEFLEMILGHVTRDVLAHSQVPLILMH
jgi:nucleotide-binding universal stress UspA family protein